MAVLENILYLDDEPLNLESFRVQFEDYYNIYIATSADLALKILSETEIKVVISDQRMPVMSGIDFLEIVKNKYPDTIRILLTAFVHEDYLMEAINKSGVFRYLTKPWKFIELNSIINNSIENYNLKNENKLLIKELQYKIDDVLRSEEKFKNIFNSSTDGIIISDGQFNILDLNNSVSNISGYTREELIGKNLRTVLPEDRSDILNERMYNLLQGNKLNDIEYKIITSQGCTIIVQANSSLINYEGQKCILTLLHEITQKKYFEKQLYIAQVNAEEAERERLARDLHDGIGPLLSALKIYVNDLNKESVKDTNLSSLQKSEEIINEVISSVKEISNNISPHVLRNFGFIQAVKGFIEKLKVKPNLNFIFKNNLESRLPDLIEITLYRITTELINNSLKYSKAQNIIIDINLNDNLLNYKFLDDGIGFDYKLLQNQNKGFGLQNIHSRIYAIGGEITYKSEPDNGVFVNIVLNLK